MTTVTYPSPAVTRQAHLGQEWCMVIVLDKNSKPHYHIKGLDAEEERRVTYLEPAAQEKFLKLKNLTMLLRLPWNHFARKNVGYLFAMSHGAKRIWDFDDDNMLIGGWLEIPGLDEETISTVEVKSSNSSTFNPYPVMGAFHTPIWPRGFPLKHIKAKETYSFDQNDISESKLELSSVAVMQSLADNDPDVDSIYRLTLPLPVNFKTNVHSMVVPVGTYVPLNAQATLFMGSSLGMLFLPTSVHGRVSDIWRGYIAQRLLRDTGKRVLISSPLVVQQRNPHDYLADFQAEQDLYLKSEVFIEVLDRLSLKSGSYASKLEQIYVELYERGFIEEQDIYMIQGWILALRSIEINLLPKDAAKTTNQPIKDTTVLHKRDHIWPDLNLFLTMPETDYKEFQQQLLQSLLLFWPLQYLNMVIVLDEESKNTEFESLMRSNTKKIHNCIIRYNKPNQFYGGKGHDRQQLIMFWADSFSSSEYVGFVDTDTLFVSPVHQDDLFEDGKPVIIGLYGIGAPSWQKKSIATANILRQGEVLRCMSYFPVIIKSKHLKEMRLLVQDIHGISFNEYFRQMRRNESYSQFNIMCNYLWHHHREEYSWHIQEYGRRVTDNTVPGQVEAKFPPEMMWPWPRVAIHTNYHFIQPSNSNRILNQILASGFCHDIQVRPFKDDYGLCRKDVVDLTVANPHMFSFEGHDWDYYPGVQESFWRRQSRLSKSPLHQWNKEQLQKLSAGLENASNKCY